MTIYLRLNSTGYLVDTVAPHNAVEVFSELLSRLRLVT
jgi:hypothetical protein